MVLDKRRKEAIIAHYKEKMKQIPCKYFDGGRGSCKFGANCHYAHKGDPIPVPHHGHGVSSAFSSDNTSPRHTKAPSFPVPKQPRTITGMLLDIVMRCIVSILMAIHRQIRREKQLP